MPYDTHEAIQRLLQRFFREELPNLSAEERTAFEQQFEDRFASLLDGASNGGGYGFADLIGFGGDGVKPFGELNYPSLRPDFDDAVIPSQLHAAAELYYNYQSERMKIFDVVDVLRRLFQLGQLRIQRGPGARGLYILEKWRPLRYSKRDRMIAYKRAFNYGPAKPPAGAVVNKNFHFQLVAFMSSFAQYFRDQTIGEVIRGAETIENRPYGNIATIQRLGTDLRYALDRASYGNILALTHEVGHYLQTALELLDTPDLKRAYQADNKWALIEQVSIQHLGGPAELSHRAKMAETGRRILQFIADNDFKTTIDPATFQSEARAMAANAEAWIAAYRMTREGRRFPGIAQNLRWAVGLPRRAERVSA